ncbi:hypothetical protein LSAT2_014003 [Lamellibrachia satsuma]|nr:hypothetical protein LSAT2_014003 [Lamellibrachia satsuma]
MKTSILVAFVLVVVTVTMVTAQSSTATLLPEPRLQFENLRTHCTGECFRLYNKQFRADISDKTDRIIKFITSCTDQCVNLMENAIEKEQNRGH